MLTKLTHLLNPPDHSLAPAAHVVTRLPFGLYGFYGLFGLYGFYGLYGLNAFYGKCIPLLLSTSIYSLYVGDKA